MTVLKALLTASAIALVASTAASAEQLAERVDRPLQSVSGVINRVEARADFGAFSAIHYDRAKRSYEILYTAKNGTPKLLIINAVTGDVTG